MEPEHREACLRPEFAELYPFLQPNIWDRATTVALKVMEARTQNPGLERPSGERVLADDHFEFRGGQPSPMFSGKRLQDAVTGGTLRERVSAMRLILQSIEAELQKGKIPPEGLEDFKTAVDDLRLRVWSILAAATTGDVQGALERFRLRRAIELSRTVAHDLESRAMSIEHGEIPELTAAAQRLVNAIQERSRS